MYCSNNEKADRENLRYYIFIWFKSDKMLNKNQD